MTYLAKDSDLRDCQEFTDAEEAIGYAMDRLMPTDAQIWNFESEHEIYEHLWELVLAGFREHCKTLRAQWINALLIDGEVACSLPIDSGYPPIVTIVAIKKITPDAKKDCTEHSS
jgi:hypothetical protein